MAQPSKSLFQCLGQSYTGGKSYPTYSIKKYVSKALSRERKGGETKCALFDHNDHVSVDNCSKFAMVMNKIFDPFLAKLPSARVLCIIS